MQNIKPLDLDWLYIKSLTQKSSKSKLLPEGEFAWASPQFFSLPANLGLSGAAISIWEKVNTCHD